MTTRQIIVQDDGSGVAPHPHDASEVSGEATFITVRVDRLLAGTINGKEIVIAGGTDGIIRSDNFVEGSAGWRGLGDGTWEINNAIIRGALINLPSGTSFPGSPSDGDLFYRTDENKAYRYDGTSWHALDFVDDANRVGSSVIATAAIQDLAVETAKINDLAVTTAKIDDLAVSTAKIANAAITNAKINDLSADKIDAGTLNADRIGTNTLRAEKLIIGGRHNLCQDPGFESNDSTIDSVHRFVDGGGSWTTGTLGPRSGAKAARYDSSSQTSNAEIQFNGNINTPSQHMSISSAHEGDTFYGSIWVDRGSGTTWPQVRLVWRFSDETGASLAETVGSAVTLSGPYEQIELRSDAAPAGTAYATLRFVALEAGSTDGVFVVDDVEMRRMVGTLVIEDQAVDIERMLDPVHQDGMDAEVQDVTIDTTLTEHVSDTFTLPSWVGEANVFNISSCQMTESSAERLISMTTVIGGSDQESASQEINNGGTTPETIVFSVPGHRLISAPGSTVAVATKVKVSSGSNSSNHVEFTAILTGTR